jgi:hypothetical protein
LAGNEASQSKRQAGFCLLHKKRVELRLHREEILPVLPSASSGATKKNVILSIKPIIVASYYFII